MNYPYYVIPDIEALAEANGEERRRLLRRIAILVGDPMALREKLGIIPEEFSAFYPDMMKPELSTSDAIDSFINKFGDKNSPSSKEVREVEELVPLPPADYDLSQLETTPIFTDEETSCDDETSHLLNNFFKSDHRGHEGKKVQSEPDHYTERIEKEENPKTPAHGPVLSESLARAMIKNGNYRKALEIITDLSLKNPKKSIYFADQIRFLKKLILNQSKREAKEPK